MYISFSWIIINLTILTSRKISKIQWGNKSPDYDIILISHTNYIVDHYSINNGETALLTMTMRR